MSDTPTFLALVAAVALLALASTPFIAAALWIERRESAKRVAQGDIEVHIQRARAEWEARWATYCAAIAKYRREIPSSKHLDDVISRACYSRDLAVRALRQEVALLESDRLSGWAWTRAALHRLLC